VLYQMVEQANSVRALKELWHSRPALRVLYQMVEQASSEGALTVLWQSRPALSGH